MKAGWADPAIVGGLGTAGAIARAAGIARQILAAHATAATIADAAVGVTAGYLGAVRGFTAVRIPGAYNHPLVD